MDNSQTSVNKRQQQQQQQQLRFRGEANANNRVEALQQNYPGDTKLTSTQQKQQQQQHDTKLQKSAATAMPDDVTTQLHSRLQNVATAQSNSPVNTFYEFFRIEMTRGYMLEHDEERYSARRQKIYSFMRIPRDLERFMVYGIMQCADSFLYIHTFLPVRFLLAIWALLSRTVATIFRLRPSGQRLLSPAEICDLLKGAIWITVTLIMLLVDTNRVYHIIKSQSIIKLYIFYNMLEVGDRLLSAFGQDTIDALFWTATEPKNSKREHFGVLTHVLFTLIYVLLHSGLIMFQATCLNVAVNSSNKGLLTIMISNNFVELKGSVFKKFDKNNLFQLTCSDVRERFHLSVLLFIVMIQTMKEFDWSLTQFCVMLPDCFAVLFTEILIDWVKHAFISRFNELPESIYREYTTSLAYDMTQTRQKHAFSDHSDLLARRMGFIPFPLAVVLIKAIYTAVSFHNLAAWVLFLLAYFFALGLRICLTICALGKACKLMKEHQTERSSSMPSSMTNVPPITNTPIQHNSSNIAGGGGGGSSSNNNNNNSTTKPTSFALPPLVLKKSLTPPMEHSMNISNRSNNVVTISSTPKKAISEVELDVTNSLELGATAIFSNSDVDLDDVRLNEHVANDSSSVVVDDELTRSQPDLAATIGGGGGGGVGGGELFAVTAAAQQDICKRSPKRTHKRSESEPGIQSLSSELCNATTQL